MDNIYTGKEAREALMRGIEKVAEPVALTIGAGGSNAIIESEYQPYSKITNDGVSVANAIELKNSLEKMGANLIKEVASRSDKESGDGTSTSVVLARAILREGMKADMNPMQLDRELNDCLPIIFDAIDKQKREITVNEVGQVATISAESEELGALIQEAYIEVGKDGIIELDNSNLPTTFIEYSEGFRIRNAGYLGAYSSTEPGKAEYKNPKILISLEKITNVEQIEGIFKALSQQGVSELVIYCEDIDMGVASRLALTHLNGGFKTLLIKAPTLWKDWIYEDLAQLTGATPIDFKNGKTFKNFTLEDLGTCDKIIATKEETRIIGTKDVSEYITTLKEKGLADDQQLLRAVWLKTKVAILKMGANTEAELSYRRLKAFDAISASKLALEDGVVAGGGVALLNVALSFDPLESLAKGILHQALQAPIIQIHKNAGLEEVWYRKAFSNEGIDVRTGKTVDMWEAGIIDAAKVTKNSVKNAISIASKVLTTAIVIPLKDETPKPLS